MSASTITLLFLAFTIIMFVWEKIPLALTAMIVTIGLILTGILDAKTAFIGFIDPNVILFVAMFIIGGALFETGMANKIGGLVTRFAKTERQLIIAVMLITGLMSGVLSNSGTAAVLVPVIIGITNRSSHFHRSRLLLPLVFAAAMGGNLSLIGSPNNLIGQSVLEQGTGLKFGFFEYAKVGLPILIAGIIYFAFIGYKFLPTANSTRVTDSIYDDNIDRSNVPVWKQYTSLIVLLASLAAMVFEDAIGIKLYISACIGAIVLVMTGVMTEKQAYKAIDSQVIFLFAGTMALAKALEMTGAGKDIAKILINFLGEAPSPFALLATIFILSCTLTQFMSNTATTALLAPISLSISNSLGADPRAVLMATVIGASCAYATPVGMPASVMVFSIGGYKFTDYTRAGLPLILVATVVSLILLPIFFPFFP